MLDLFIRLQALVKVSKIHIDSSVFRLHWFASPVILLTFSVLVTVRQYIGDPIDCIHTKDIPSEVFDMYCWIHSTYTVPRGMNLRIGHDVAHPGVFKSDADDVDDADKRFVKYYPWVGPMLLLQVRHDIT